MVHLPTLWMLHSKSKGNKHFAPSVCCFRIHAIQFASSKSVKKKIIPTGISHTTCILIKFRLRFFFLFLFFVAAWMCCILYRSAACPATLMAEFSYISIFKFVSRVIKRTKDKYFYHFCFRRSYVYVPPGYSHEITNVRRTCARAHFSLAASVVFHLDTDKA